MLIERRATVTQPTIYEHLDLVSLFCILPGYVDAIVCQTNGAGPELRTTGNELARLVSLRRELGNPRGDGTSAFLRKSEMFADCVSKHVDAASELYRVAAAMCYAYGSLYQKLVIEDACSL
jgi:hypothetical protein